MFEQNSRAADPAFALADESVGDDVFALRIRNDSMVDSAGGHSFPPGCTIIVDPTVKAIPGHYVVLDRGENAIFRQLTLDGEQYMLKALNPLYAPTPLSSAKIRGVVVQVQVLTEAGKRQQAKHEALTAA